MKLSVDTCVLSLRFGDFECARMVKEAGFDCLDMTYACDIHSPVLNDDFREYATKLRQHLDALGLECNQAHAPFIFNQGDKFTLDDDHYKAVVRSIESASILGAKYIVVHTTGYTSNSSVLFDREYNIEYFRSLIPYCEKFGIKMAVENLFTYDEKRGAYFGRLGTPDELTSFVKELDSPLVCACVDTGHASLTGCSPEDFISNMSGDVLKVLHIHDGDYKGDKHTLPYLLEFNWANIMRSLKNISYDGDLTYEIVCYFAKIPDKLIPEALRFAEMTGRHLISLFENA